MKYWKMEYGGNIFRQNTDIMIIEIESYNGDTLLSGKPITYQEFLRQVEEIESDYDRILDNFVALLCRRYGWIIAIEKGSEPTYVYDRDAEKAYKRVCSDNNLL